MKSFQSLSHERGEAAATSSVQSPHPAAASWRQDVHCETSCSAGHPRPSECPITSKTCHIFKPFARLKLSIKKKNKHFLTDASLQTWHKTRLRQLCAGAQKGEKATVHLLHEQLIFKRQQPATPPLNQL